MEMRNFSPFPNLRFYNTDNQGREFGVVLVKATYVIRDGRLKIADEQAPLLFEDTYHGALNASSLLFASDLVSKKPNTDIILNAIARAPNSTATPRWTCGIVIEGNGARLEKRLKVCGPRSWNPTWHVSESARSGMSEKERDRSFRGWVLEEPSAATEVPIRFEYAYGGTVRRPRADGQTSVLEAYEYNPVGRGWIDPTDTPRNMPVPAPQIEDFESASLVAMRHRPPAGFGPIPPVWLPRRPLGGTFDDHWLAEVWPNWPKDYDFAYNNSAALGMVYPGYLKGDETIVLDGLIADPSPQRMRLPDHRISVVFDDDRRTLRQMDLDTMMMDIADTDADEHRVYISWRATFDPEVQAITFVLHRGDVTQEERAAQPLEDEAAE